MAIATLVPPVIGVAMAVVLSASGGASAETGCGASGGPCVVVTVEGDSPTTQVFGVDDLTALEDLVAPAYEIRSTAGGGTQSEPRPDRAVSLQRLLSSVATGPGSTLAWQSVTFAEVVDRNGGTHPLTNAQLGNPGANGFADGLMPGLFVVGGNDAIGYVRPLTPDPGDVNVKDFFQTLSGGALQIVAHTQGTLLTPSVQASSTQTQAGAAVGFSVSFPRPPGTALTYTWDFGDGVPSGEAAPAHIWAAAGTYAVSVTVEGADGSYGRSAPVLVTVGATPTPTPTTSPTSGTGPSATTGPSTGPNTSTPSPSAAPTTSATTTAATVASPGPTIAAPAATTSGPTAPATASAAPSKRPGKDHSTASGPTVSGVLLAGGSAQELPATVAADRAPDAARRAETEPVRPGWVVAWGALGLALLGAGALGESGLGAARRGPGWQDRLRRRSGSGAD